MRQTDFGEKPAMTRARKVMSLSLTRGTASRTAVRTQSQHSFTEFSMDLRFSGCRKSSISRSKSLIMWERSAGTSFFSKYSRLRRSRLVKRVVKSSRISLRSSAVFSAGAASGPESSFAREPLSKILASSSPFLIFLILWARNKDKMSQKEHMRINASPELSLRSLSFCSSPAR